MRRPWRLRDVEGRIRKRLADLSARLGEAEWLDARPNGGEFTAADLLMVSALQRFAGSGLLEEHTNLPAYVARAEARPAYRRAFAAQLAAFHAADSR